MNASEMRIESCDECTPFCIILHWIDVSELCIDVVVRFDGIRLESSNECNETRIETCDECPSRLGSRVAGNAMIALERIGVSCASIFCVKLCCASTLGMKPTRLGSRVAKNALLLGKCTKPPFPPPIPTCVSKTGLQDTNFNQLRLFSSRSGIPPFLHLSPRPQFQLVSRKQGSKTQILIN